MSNKSKPYIAILAAAVSTLFLSTAEAQYYGGVSLSGTSDVARGSAFGGAIAPQSKLFEPKFSGFNGGQMPSELLSLVAKPDSKSGVSGLNLSASPSLGFKLGYRFNPYLALEARYASVNPIRQDANLFSGDARFAASSLQSTGLDLVGNFALAQKLSLQGRTGFRSERGQHNELVSRQFGDGGFANVANIASTTTFGVVGLSLNYNLSQSLGLRFEVERSRKFFNDKFAYEPDNASNVSFGVLWRF